jgi:hypothetical protein
VGEVCLVRIVWADGSDDRSISESFDSESTSGTPAQTQARPVTRPSPGRWQPGDTYGKSFVWVWLISDDPIPAQRSLSGNQIGGRRSPAVGSPEKSTAGKIDPGKSTHRNQG